MTTERARNLLRLTGVFGSAGVAELEVLAAAGRFRRLGRGEALFREGDGATALYVVEGGWLSVSKFSGAREVALHVVGPRQVVSGVSVFVPGATVSATAVALEDAAVFAVDAQVVRRTCFASPVLAEAVIAYFARRHAEVLGRLEQLVFQDLNARLAGHLLAHAPEGAAYALPSNSALAAQLGTVPELVSRKLGEFYRRGFIALQRRSVRVVDADALRRLLP
ncbi:Crp/Fnr family transcriptional regulator [Deinococcus maricopensis]|uniref:Transcriptional regulator, Crp/Fnr family n=1 Tax=Deinococcus maricopensis (strain DSM 21211 / LMG 22137 / NRRL B-23946 / LB-34) TaxID=709986 RepID=E8UBL4_DEIML|nr:Crp/Fnr family transcriptional regulator [Deinococcus maricopensis]ADV68453.1 transcriptional regulator, Crp/Fnr family [Deinococcus maricopensis DSM 21211]